MAHDELPLPATGGGYPVIAAAGRIMNPYDRTTRSKVTLTLSTDADAEANGRRVVELVRKNCVARDLERVAILHTLFRDVACRVPEFHIVVHEISTAGDHKKLAKLLGLPHRGRGRRPGDVLFFTAVIEYVMEHEGFTETTAAVGWLIANREALDLPDRFLPSAKALLNQHGRLGEYFQLWSSSIYVKPELLTLMPPELPGGTYTPEMIELAHFPPKDGSSWPLGFLVEVQSATSNGVKAPKKK